MASTDADICNLALARIGELKQITSPIASDTSTEGRACAALYPQARDLLLARMRWRFATATKWLYEDGKLNSYSKTPTYAVQGFRYVYVLPTDIIEPRYLFSGVRPGQGAYPIAIEQLLYVTAVSQLPALSGMAPQIPFEVASGFLFTDYTDVDDPPAYNSGTTYSTGDVVAYNGNAYVSLQNSNAGHTPDVAGSAYWASTNAIALTYTQQVTDVTKMPALFVDALAWRLAVDLAASLAGKPDLAAALERKAEMSLSSAMAVEANAREPDPRPDSNWIAGRG